MDKDVYLCSSRAFSHQLKMIASVRLFIFCQYIDTRESLNTLDDVKGNTVSGKKKQRTEKLYCNK